MNHHSKQYLSLHKKWTEKHKSSHKTLFANHRNVNESLKKHLVGMFMFITIPFLNIFPNASQSATSQQQTIAHITRRQLIKELQSLLPEDVIPLTKSQEQKVTQLLSERFHIPVTVELSGIRLERNYGIIGKEQHLKRFPGDSIDQLFDSEEEAQKFADAGIAPGLGAWGYFTKSKSELTPKDKVREKYYIAVQTFLAPGFNEHVGEYGLFFKYRKMLVVNPENGKAIVVDIADAGPATDTGKHLGGSPEVMDYLEREDGAKKGPVLFFFVDDLNDTIPLGPITL